MACVSVTRSLGLGMWYNVEAHKKCHAQMNPVHGRRMSDVQPWLRETSSFRESKQLSSKRRQENEHTVQISHTSIKTMRPVSLHNMYKWILWESSYVTQICLLTYCMCLLRSWSSRRRKSFAWRRVRLAGSLTDYLAWLLADCFEWPLAGAVLLSIGWLFYLLCNHVRSR